jgi:hypothetical protein
MNQRNDPREAVETLFRQAEASISKVWKDQIGIWGEIVRVLGALERTKSSKEIRVFGVGEANFEVHPRVIGSAVKHRGDQPQV